MACEYHQRDLYQLRNLAGTPTTPPGRTLDDLKALGVASGNAGADIVFTFDTLGLGVY